MKRIILAALVLAGAAPAFAADNAPAEPRIVREFLTNRDATDWMLDAGWTWSDGKLTHWPGLRGVAQQVTMPQMTAGRTYRISITFGDYTQGTVTVSLGNATFPTYGAEGTWTLLAEVTDPPAFLTFSPSSDYQGSISKIRVVELGNELFDPKAGATAEGWAVDGDALEHSSDSTISLERAVPVIAGHSYRLYFGARRPPNADPTGATGTVSLSRKTSVVFTPDWNYARDVVATQDNRLVVTPTPEDGAPAIDWSLVTISVREITSDPVNPPVAVQPATN